MTQKSNLLADCLTLVINISSLVKIEGALLGKEYSLQTDSSPHTSVESFSFKGVDGMEIWTVAAAEVSTLAVAISLFLESFLDFKGFCNAVGSVATRSKFSSWHSADKRVITFLISSLDSLGC